VVTGQQTGLFGGPLFTLYKALTAIKLAARLNRTCEGCYVPVFWLASDDHDFREANHVCILDRENIPRRIAYEGYSTDARVPISELLVKEEISDCLQELDESTSPSEFKAEILDELAAAYAPGSGFAGAFGTWLTRLFKAFGLILIDPSDARVKALAREVFRQEIEERSPSTETVLDASARLQAAGYPVQVQLHRGRLNLFYVSDERHAVEIADDGFRVKGENLEFSRAELLQVLETKPEALSPNVILRPIYQDAVLPTVAYVAGPAEIAYFAQLKGVYERFGLPMPIIFPRKSVTLLERHIDKILERYALTVPDFWGDVEPLITRIVQAQLPEALEKQIESVVACVNKDLRVLEEAVTEFEPTLKSTVANTRNRISGQIEHLNKKITQAYKKRNDVIAQQLHKAQNNLFPNHKLQERELNVVPYLFKYGFELVDRLYEAIDIADFDHQIIRT